jgi:hypothetical protein
MLTEHAMRELSPSDGSADAVRNAADEALSHSDNRPALERELDRLNSAVQGSAAALGQHLSWLLVAQALLLTSYLIVLVGGWGLPLPGKRGLLMGIAIFAVCSVGATYLGLRAARDRVGPLKAQRQRVEDALERVAGRPPAFARQGTVTALLAQASTRGLPLMVVVGWIALAIYALALPLPSEPRPAAASSESRASPAAATTAPRAPRPAAAKSGPAVAPAPDAPAAAVVANDASESPLMNFLRRAVNAPPPVESQEPVKP